MQWHEVGSTFPVIRKQLTTQVQLRGSTSHMWKELDGECKPFTTWNWLTKAIVVWRVMAGPTKLTKWANLQVTIKSTFRSSNDLPVSFAGKWYSPVCSWPEKVLSPMPIFVSIFFAFSDGESVGATAGNVFCWLQPAGFIHEIQY